VWRRACLIAVVGAVTYAASLSGPFLFDDDASVVDNTTIRNLRPSVALQPDRESPTAGRPLVNLTFAINYAIGGLNVVGYHATNIAIHLLCGLLLFGLARRTLDLPRIPASLRQWSADLAFAIALLWVVHPLNSEAVDYITQRTESLMALFYLLTLYCALRATVGPHVRGVRLQADRRWAAASIVSCALGMACKESMVTAPLMVLIYDRVFLYDSIRRAFRARRLWYGGLAATWILLAALLQSAPRVYSAGFHAGVSPWTYLLNQAVMIARYLRLAVWPRSLVLAYGIPLPLSVGDVVLPALLILALLALTAVALVRRPLLGFLGLWFFITLAPTSSIVPIATEVGAERRMYLPLVALVTLTVVAIGPRLRRRAAIALLASVTAALSAQTNLRHREYATSSVMAQTILDRWPTGFAHARMGIELARAGNHDDAIAHLRESVKTYPKGHFHLGVELFATGHADEAFAQLQQFVTEQPQLLEAVRARTIVGRILLAKHRHAEAIDQFRLVLSMTAPADEAHITGVGFLADALFDQQKFGEALPYYQTFVAARPNDVGALTNIGISLASVGKAREATAVFRRIVEISPTDLSARRNLAKALLNEDQIDAAESETNALLGLKADDAVGHDLKGRVLASRGRLADARAEFERAVQLDPRDEQARADLALVLRALGAR
jgi:tetratricopeptide (TPR) repeat protein